MKIMWNEATAGAPELEPLWNLLRNYFPKVAAAGTEVDLRHVGVSGGYVRSLYTSLLNHRSVVENCIAAERDGFDAVVIGCWCDPLWEARGAVDIPVVGIGEAAMLLAHTVGYKYAVITVAPGAAPPIESDVRLYGLEDRAIVRPVRWIDIPADRELILESVADPERRLIPSFERVARQCIEDGADVILVGCGYYGPILTTHGYNKVSGTDVPVVDASAAGLKLAETLAGLRDSIGLKVSRARFFRGAPPEVLEESRCVHGLT